MIKMNNRALVKISEKLAFGLDEITSTVKLAMENPQQYIGEFSDELEDRGISEPFEALPWIALVDALIEHQLADEIDWKEENDDIIEVIDQLLQRKQLPRVDWTSLHNEHDDETSTDEFLEAISVKLEEQSMALAYLDIDSDSYVLIVVKDHEISELKELAEEAGFNILDEY